MIAVLCAYAEKINFQLLNFFFALFYTLRLRSQRDDKNNDSEIQKGGEKQLQMRLLFGEEKFFWLWRATNLNSSEPLLAVCEEIYVYAC